MHLRFCLPANRLGWGLGWYMYVIITHGKRRVQ